MRNDADPRRKNMLPRRLSIASCAAAAVLMLAGAAVHQPLFESGELADHPRWLACDEGTSAGARSIAGTGHVVRFEAPDDASTLTAVRIYGSRYGAAEAPPKEFRLWLCDAKFGVISESRFPLGRFERGSPQWVELTIPPTQVPREFIVCAGFDPTSTRGVYVHFDGRAGGRSATGLPGRALRPFDEGDWMIRVGVEPPKALGAWARPLRTILASPQALYLLNLAIAAVVISGAALLAATLARRQPLTLRYGLLCVPIALLLICPLGLGVAGRLHLGAVRVAAEDESSVDRPTGVPGVAGARNDRFAAQRETPNLAAEPRNGPRAAPTVQWLPAAGGSALVHQLVRATGLAWLVGALVIFARWARGLRAIGRLRRSLEPNHGPRLAMMASRAFRAAGLAGDVPIRTSPLAPGPLVLGAWRPQIVLPAGLDRELTDDELLCVLAHEAAHVARRDAWVALGQRLAAAVFWWNPLVHVINGRIHYLRECMCDDCAARACGDGERLALALVRIAQWCLGPRPRLAGAAMLFDEDNLRNRITRLIEGERTMNGRSTSRTVVCLMAVVVVAPGFAFVPAIVAQTETAVRQVKAAPAGAKEAKGRRLSHNDGTAENKRSIGGSGEMISFALPDENARIAGLRIHGSRYGYPRPPKEDFMIYFLNEDMSETVATKTAPYSRFKRGDQQWVEIRFPKPIEVPQEFWVCLDFRAEQTKGVYVSIDESTDGSHSRVGLPGMQSREANVGGDWMIEAVLAK